MLPSFIKKALYQKKTSIGDNPCLPPDEEVGFLYSLLSSYYDELVSDSSVDIEKLKLAITKGYTKCKKLEDNSKEALTELADRVLSRIFDIPADTINIELELVNEADTSDERLVPEKTDDFEFDSIEDMSNLTEEIYKRRFLNALVNGASRFYAKNINIYLEDLFNINDTLPSIYKRLFTYDDILLYNDDKLSPNPKQSNGRVDVNITNNEAAVSIKAKGINLPTLIEYGVKGILELAIAHGLPDDIDKANYILKKTDFKLAEIWDLRLGMPLWECLVKRMQTCDIDIDNVGINFIFMSISELKPKDFNKFFQEVLKGTKKGKEYLVELSNTILEKKSKDDFQDFIDKTNQEMYPLNDSEYFSSEDLLN